MVKDGDSVGTRSVIGDFLVPLDAVLRCLPFACFSDGALLGWGEACDGVLEGGIFTAFDHRLKL